MKKIKYVLFLLILMVVFSSLVYAGGGPSMSGKSKGYAEKSYPVKEPSQDSTKGNQAGSYRQGPPAKECLGFFDDTSGLRKEFANRRSALTKAEEDPKTDPQDIAIRKKEIRDLFRTIEEKNTRNCRWVY